MIGFWNRAEVLITYDLKRLSRCGTSSRRPAWITAIRPISVRFHLNQQAAWSTVCSCTGTIWSGHRPY